MYLIAATCAAWLVRLKLKEGAINWTELESQLVKTHLEHAVVHLPGRLHWCLQAWASSSNRFLWDVSVPYVHVQLFGCKQKLIVFVSLLIFQKWPHPSWWQYKNTPENTPKQFFDFFFILLGWAREPYSLLGKYSSVWLGLSGANNSPPGRMSVWKACLRLRHGGEESVVLWFYSMEGGHRSFSSFSRIRTCPWRPSYPHTIHYIQSSSVSLV